MKTLFALLLAIAFGLPAAAQEQPNEGHDTHAQQPTEPAPNAGHGPHGQGMACMGMMARMEAMQQRMDSMQERMEKMERERTRRNR